MKRRMILAMAVALSLTGTIAAAEGDRAKSLTKPVAAQMAADDIKAEVTLGTKAHKGGYGNPDIVFFFVLAYLASVVVVN